MTELSKMMESLSVVKRHSIIKPHGFNIPIEHCPYYVKKKMDAGCDEATIRKDYDALKLNQKMIYFYLSKAGHNYYFTENNKDVITHLSMYFTGMIDSPCTLSLNKGIALYGYFGTGKTMMLDVFKTCMVDMRNTNNYYVTSIEQIIDYFREHNSIKKFYYNWSEGEKYSPFNLVINEFGTQVTEKFYGTNISEVINELMMLRYEAFTNRSNPKLTHITTNDSRDALFKNLPMKLRDRFTEMFNFIELKGKSLRR